MSKRRTVLRRLGVGAGVVGLGVGGAWYGGLIGPTEPEPTADETDGMEQSDDGSGRDESDETEREVDPPAEDWRTFQ